MPGTGGEAVPRQSGGCGGGVRCGGKREPATSASSAVRRSQRRNDQSLFPTKLSGVTSTIAIACETILPQPSQSRKTSSQSWFTQNAAKETPKKRAPW